LCYHAADKQHQMACKSARVLFDTGTQGCVMTVLNGLLLALTSVFVACNQLGVDPAVLPYLAAISAISVAMAVVAVRKGGSAASAREQGGDDVVRHLSSPRERRC
jgi:molybdopterin-guanine dinucleotide biosynthesis protein A